MSYLIKVPAIDFARSIGHVRTCIGHFISVSILKYDEDPKIKPTNIIDEFHAAGLYPQPRDRA